MIGLFLTGLFCLVSGGGMGADLMEVEGIFIFLVAMNDGGKRIRKQIGQGMMEWSWRGDLGDELAAEGGSCPTGARST